MLTLCNVYLQDRRKQQLETLLIKLPKLPFLVVGDFDSHNTLWGSAQIDARVELTEDHNIIIINDGSHTHLNVYTGLTSALDLTGAYFTPSLASKLSWYVLENYHHSNPTSIIVEWKGGDENMHSLNQI